MASDNELLDSYATRRSEEAFAELVRRHLNLVYFTALRRTNGQAALAEEIAQQVFLALARQAPALRRHAVLTGWLYVATRHAAAKAMRAEQRRKTREQTALTMHEISSDPTPEADWNRLRPELDAVLDELGDRDRNAVLLRFFENRPFAEIGAVLRLSEDAARMRVDRALGRLRDLLARRGITSTTAALALALEQPVGAAAPAALAASINGAVAGVVVAGGVAATAINWSALHFMSTSKITMTAAALVALFGVAASLYELGEARAAKARIELADRQQGELQARLRGQEGRRQSLEKENENLRRALEVAAAGKAAPEATAAAPMTKAAIDARYQRGLELARSGHAEEALRELLWCYDDGFPRVSAYRTARNRTLLIAIGKLGDQYPDALAALGARRDAAEKRILADKFDFEAASDFVAINGVLHADDQSLQFYDQMAPDDQRRVTMASNLYDQFVGAQRYREALQAQPYARMSGLADNMTRAPDVAADDPNREEILKSTHDFLVATTAKNIEVLAGAGDLVHARALADKVIAYDGSDETRTALWQHAERAGHPELLIPAQANQRD